MGYAADGLRGEWVAQRTARAAGWTSCATDVMRGGRAARRTCCETDEYRDFEVKSGPEWANSAIFIFLP